MSYRILKFSSLIRVYILTLISTQHFIFSLYKRTVCPLDDTAKRPFFGIYVLRLHE